MRNKKSRYDLQSVLSTACKLSCKRTALKRCTNIEILWYRKLVSLASPEFREILLTTSLRRWRADALNIIIVTIKRRDYMHRCSTFNTARHQSSSLNSASPVLTLVYVLVHAAITAIVELLVAEFRGILS